MTEDEIRDLIRELRDWAAGTDDEELRGLLRKAANVLADGLED